MKVLIISPGKAHDTTVKEGIAEFEKRLRKIFQIEWMMPSASEKKKEGEAIAKVLKESDFMVLLDERGEDIDTPAFANFIDARMQSGVTRLVFVIGGAYGVDEEVMRRADATYKLSSLVFPHMLVRFILIEQLYRAVSIREGGKYHHA
jgi:23S rRNA (pseudouridine1915-N3)-methyltransferase